MTPATTTNNSYSATLAAKRIAPYRAEESGRGLHSCIDDVNRAVFECYGPDPRAGSEGKIIVDTLFQYERLIRGLASVPHLEFVTHHELHARPGPADKILCAIRHDVDADIRAAEAEAEIEHAFGARSTFYVLHTAPYYGVFTDGEFHRNGCMAILYRRIESFGHEIALHTDPLHLYQNLKLDGAESVRAEIAWLRGEGLAITGTVAHNSAPVYGIENFAIFAGRNRRGLGLDAANDDVDLLTEVVHDGKWAPLGVLDETELGLTYEGNDVFRMRDVPLEYGAARRLNRWRWNAHIKRLKAAPDPTEDPFIDQDRLLADIAALPPGRRLVLNVHPLYYGSRHAVTSAPPLRVQSIATTTSDALGWETYEPATLQACAGDPSGAMDAGQDADQEFQSINFSDERGMLDAPVPSTVTDADPRILVLGGRNVDGRSIGVPEHATSQAGARLAGAAERAVVVRKLAFPGMGFCRHYGWFAATCTTEHPNVVVIGIGADEITQSRPHWWSRTTGFAAAHPPGAYLDHDGETVRVIDRSPGAAIRRGVVRAGECAAEREPNSRPSLTDAGAQRRHASDIDGLGQCLAYYADSVRAAGATPVCLLQECGESAGLWRPGGDARANADGHARCREIVDAWTQAATLTLIDPYERFLAQPASLPPHWSTTPEWNHTGHRLAAAAMFIALFPLLAPPPATSDATLGGER